MLHHYLYNSLCDYCFNIIIDLFKSNNYLPSMPMITMINLVMFKERLVFVPNCCMTRMLPSEAELNVSAGGGAKCKAL